MPETHPIQLITVDSPEEVSEGAAAIIGSLVGEKPDVTLGLATGGTPVKTYERLVQRHRDGGLDFTNVKSFNLDEYVGLGGEHPQSFRYFMQANLFDQINIDRENTFVPNGLAENVTDHCKHYESMIQEHGGIELQLLGIGHNGHIAFNEPGSTFDSRTREVDLTDETIKANARFFDSIADVPRTAITMGIGTILEAERILLIAYGEGKRDAITKMVRGEPNETCPASLLQYHSDVTVIVDRAAAPEA